MSYIKKDNMLYIFYFRNTKF